jgi:hypothetical protein
MSVRRIECSIDKFHSLLAVQSGCVATPCVPHRASPALQVVEGTGGNYTHWVLSRLSPKLLFVSFCSYRTRSALYNLARL